MYSIDDADGQQLTTGLTEQEARRVAQRMANDRRECVHLYADADPDNDCETVYPDGR